MTLFRTIHGRFFLKKWTTSFLAANSILTTRPTDRWLKSVLKHFGKKDTPMRKWIYGVGHPLGHEKVFTDRYEAHYAEVAQHFKVRPEDLLVFPLTEGAGWSQLCPFLEKPISRGALSKAEYRSDPAEEPKNLRQRKRTGVWQSGLVSETATRPGLAPRIAFLYRSAVPHRPRKKPREHHFPAGSTAVTNPHLNRAIFLPRASRTDA